MKSFQVFWFSCIPFAGKISSRVKKLCLLTFLDDKADILQVCLSKLYWALFCSILLFIVFIFSLTVFYDTFVLNLNGSPDGKVVSFSKNKKGFFSIIFVKNHETFKLHTRWMIWCYLLKFSFVKYFHGKICRILSNILGALKQYCDTKTSEMLQFLPLSDDSTQFFIGFSICYYFIKDY